MELLGHDHAHQPAPPAVSAARTASASAGSRVQPCSAIQASRPSSPVTKHDRQPLIRPGEVEHVLAVVDLVPRFRQRHRQGRQLDQQRPHPGSDTSTMACHGAGSMSGAERPEMRWTR